MGKLPGLKDKDLGSVGKDVGACESVCTTTTSCVAVVWHKDDHHCHVVTGPTPTHAQLEASLKKDFLYETCFLTA